MSQDLFDQSSLQANNHCQNWSIPARRYVWLQYDRMEEGWNTAIPSWTIRALRSGREYQTRKVFSANNLVTWTGIKTVIWTDIVPDHLRILEQETSIAILYHASFLKAHQNR